MSRMLFLRDIQVDIRMRCRDCGHEGVLARPDLERRFGPNYPVLSIAPHYRCSRCNSKDVESGPASHAGATFTAAAAQPEDFGGAIGALQGLLNAVRGEPGKEDGVRDLTDDDLLDTMTEEPEGEGTPLERAMTALRRMEPDEPDPDEPAPDEPAPNEPTAAAPEIDAFDELLSKLAPARSYEDEDAGEDAEPQPASEPPPPAAAEAQSPFDETLAALRALTSTPEAEDENAGPWDDEGPAYTLRDDGILEPAEEPRDDLPEDLPEDLDDIPDEEIVSFAIRDPDAAPDLPPDDEAGEDGEEPADETPLMEFASYRRPPPEPGSLDESLAALRALVEKAAAEDPEPEPARRPASRKAPPIEEPPVEDPAIEDPAAEDEEPEEPFPQPPLKTAQEKSLEETLAQLRGMLDLDKDSGEEGEPVIKPRRR